MAKKFFDVIGVASAFRHGRPTAPLTKAQEKRAIAFNFGFYDAQDLHQSKLCAGQPVVTPYWFDERDDEKGYGHFNHDYGRGFATGWRLACEAARKASKPTETSTQAF